VEHAKADLEQKKLDWDRAQALYKDGIMAKQDFDAKKAAYDLDVASLDQAVAGLNQAKANTDSAKGHLQNQVATLRANQDLLNRTIAMAPFDGIVTNEPVREGETVVEGIQNTEGSTLMTLADMSVVTAEVKVDETDIMNVKMDQPADVTVDALPGQVFKGTVTLVGDQALLRSTGIATSQSTTGTEEAKDFKVVVTLLAPTSELRPGLSCTAKITTAHKPSVLSLPIQALTMHDPASDSTKNKGAVQAASARRATTRIQRGAGRLRGGKGCQRQPARKVCSSHNGDHGRHRYRGAVRPQRGPGDRHRPVQDAAGFEGRLALEAGYGQTDRSHYEQQFLAPAQQKNQYGGKQQSSRRLRFGWL